MTDLFAEMSRRYRTGDLPWNQELPPPEVIALASTLQPGRALDLGCGPGRASVYLAQLGWHCDGVDFVPEAVAMAVERAKTAGVSERTAFHVASVTQLDFLHNPYNIAIDVGCMHNLRGADLAAYAAELARLLVPHGLFLLFARLTEHDDEPRGLPEQTIRDTFAADFVCERAEPGETMFNGMVARSAWFWLRRT